MGCRPVGAQKSPPASLRQGLLHRVPVHVGQPVIAPLEAERQARVVQTKLMQNRGLLVVDVNDLVDGVAANLVRLAVDEAGLDVPAASHVV